jgi:hypothetical protein
MIIPLIIDFAITIPRNVLFGFIRYFTRNRAVRASAVRILVLAMMGATKRSLMKTYIAISEVSRYVEKSSILGLFKIFLSVKDL